MPYQRKRRYTSYKKRRAVKGYKLTYRQKKEVKQMIGRNMELKSIDETGGASAPALGLITRWFNIPQGTGNTQRIGNDINATHLELQYDITQADAFNRVRVIVFQWALDDATAVPTINDILFVGATNYFNALYNFDNRDKYKILHDRRYLLENTSVGISSVPKSSPIYKLKIPHKQILFNGSGATTGRFMIYQLLCSDSASVPNPNVVTNIRLIYRDA